MNRWVHTILRLISVVVMVGGWTLTVSAETRDAVSVVPTLVCDGDTTMGSVTVRGEDVAIELACDAAVGNPNIIGDPHLVGDPTRIEWQVLLTVSSARLGEQKQTCEFQITSLPVRLSCVAVGDPTIAVEFEAVVIGNPDI